MKFINCYIFFWAIFALLDPDPDPRGPNGSGYEFLFITLVKAFGFLTKLPSHANPEYKRGKTK
jgi:hypothetical protein